MRAALAGRSADATSEDVDIELLARKRIEQMVEKEPERVGELLSRWVLGESPYAGSSR